MDGRDFDRMIRAFAGAQSRRSAFKKALAIVAGMGAAGVNPAGAARRGYPGPLEYCPSGESKCGGSCYPSDTIECCGGIPCTLGQCADGVCCSPDVGYLCSPGDGSSYCASHGSCCTAAECSAPGTCQEPGSCDASSGSCIYPLSPDGTVCGAGQECCGGACCPSQSICEGGVCVSTCLGLGSGCVDESECCQDLGYTACDGVCCLGTYESCSGPGDCCSGQCNGEFCCAGPNSACSDDGECCGGELGACDGGVCRCRQQGESCSGSFECCGFDTCESGVCTAGACTDPGGSCRSDFECCNEGGLAYCQEFGPDGSGNLFCCRYTGGTCTTSDDCCASDVCTNGACCRPPGDNCTVGGDCCSGTCCDGVCCDSLLSCINDICRETCPLGGFACGTTECCGSHEHCIDGGCMCLPLRSECDPANNLCCQSGDTMCYPIGSVGMEFEHCCQGLGSACNPDNDATLGSDCCSLSADFVGYWVGACGTDGVCGGLGGVCFSDNECVNGQCRGHCGNQFPLKSCLTHAECDCDGDLEDGCVEHAGHCIETRCR